MYSNKPYLRENFSQEDQKSRFMLVRFIVSNFMSFKEETEFNMLPASGQKRLKEHIYNAETDVLKMAAIYGANGAGKSNLVKAIAVMQSIVISSDFSGVKKFKLDKDSLNKPTKFEIEFIHLEKVYGYGLIVDANAIIEEWLWENLPNERLIFSRTLNGDKFVINIPNKDRTEEEKLRIKLYENEFLKPELAFLKLITSSKDSFEEIKEVYNFIQNSINILTPNSVSVYLTGTLDVFPDILNFLNDNITTISSGISRIGFTTMDIYDYWGENETHRIQEIKRELRSQKGAFLYPNKPFSPIAKFENDKIVVKSLACFHLHESGVEVAFDIEEESDGTKRILDIIPWLYYAITEGYVILIDEIEMSIHVNLLKELISKFSDDVATCGQLIFTTHESNLLDQDILRQDEIWFAEKNPAGETGFYPLSDYEIRSDLDIRKGYLNGRFGAIPFLANLHDLNWDKYAKEV
jgi:hypothetical protein